MATSLNLVSVFSTQHRSAGVQKSRNSVNVICLPLKRPNSVTFACNSPETEFQPADSKPEIELEFIGPKPRNDGSYPVDKAKAISGEKLLRNIMLDNKIELYATYGKIMNCGGGGSCGTCIVEIIDGSDLLNDRTNTELRYLKKNSALDVAKRCYIYKKIPEVMKNLKSVKPESWRLACQTIVGNKQNSGKVVVQRIPQRKN